MVPVLELEKIHKQALRIRKVIEKWKGSTSTSARAGWLSESFGKESQSTRQPPCRPSNMSPRAGTGLMKKVFFVCFCSHSASSQGKCFVFVGSVFLRPSFLGRRKYRAKDTFICIFSHPRFLLSAFSRPAVLKVCLACCFSR